MNATHPPTFFDRVVAATPDGELLSQCLQCGTCGGSCPSAADMDHTPRELFAMTMAGLEDEVLASNTPWYCVSCYACTVRCPQEIPITDLMYTFKQMAIETKRFQHQATADWSESFVGFVEQRGRSFELGLATRYHLFHHPAQVFKMGALGLNMLRHNRLALRPKSIRDIEQLRAILDKAKVLAEKEAWR